MKFRGIVLAYKNTNQYCAKKPAKFAMKRLFLLAAAFAGSSLLLNPAGAQTVATDPVGFVQPFATSPNMLANSDTIVSVPFTRPPEFVGAVSSVSGSTITVSGSPFTASPPQFVYAAGTQPKTYFVLIGPHSTTNPKQGFIYQVTGNGTNTLTLNLNGDDISGIASTTQILVIPYNTLSSVFPDSDANVSFVPSANKFIRQTQILIPGYSGSGINRPASATYYYSSGAWRLFGEDVNNHDDDILLNPGYFTVRNAATGTTLTTLGSVVTKNVTIPLFTRTSSAQDNFVSVIRPIDLKLNDLGLITSGAFLSSPNQFIRTDQLLVFNPAQTGQNKPASATYFYSQSAWRLFGDQSFSDHGNDMIAAGSGFIIRKAATGSGAPAYWQNAPTY